jgi:hypothetical protein
MVSDYFYRKALDIGFPLDGRLGLDFRVRDGQNPTHKIREIVEVAINILRGIAWLNRHSI